MEALGPEFNPSTHTGPCTVIWALGRLTGGSLGLAGHPLATRVLGRQISGSLGLAGHPLVTWVLGWLTGGSLRLAGHPV